MGGGSEGLGPTRRLACKLLLLLCLVALHAEPASAVLRLRKWGSTPSVGLFASDAPLGVASVGPTPSASLSTHGFSTANERMNANAAADFNILSTRDGEDAVEEASFHDAGNAYSQLEQYNDSSLNFAYKNKGPQKGLLFRGRRSKTAAAAASGGLNTEGFRGLSALQVAAQLRDEQEQGDSDADKETEKASDEEEKETDDSSGDEDSSKSASSSSSSNSSSENSAADQANTSDTDVADSSSKTSAQEAEETPEASSQAAAAPKAASAEGEQGETKAAGEETAEEEEEKQTKSEQASEAEAAPEGKASSAEAQQQQTTETAKEAKEGGAPAAAAAGPEASAESTNKNQGEAAASSAEVSKSETGGEQETSQGEKEKPQEEAEGEEEGEGGEEEKGGKTAEEEEAEPSEKETKSETEAKEKEEAETQEEAEEAPTSEKEEPSAPSKAEKPETKPVQQPPSEEATEAAAPPPTPAAAAPEEAAAPAPTTTPAPEAAAKPEAPTTKAEAAARPGGPGPKKTEGAGEAGKAAAPEGAAAPAAEASATLPPEESSPEKAEGWEVSARRKEELEKPAEGKCYSDIAKEVIDEENALIMKATENVHFQEAEQGFCDEVFRRIDGPFSLNELSALLRAADVANSTHRNFRYCRATENSSPPRVMDGDSLLHAAIAARKPLVVEVLLQYGAFPELPAIPHKERPQTQMGGPLHGLKSTEMANGTPMHAAALVQTPDSVEAMELLLHYGAKTDSRDTWGRTPLMIAAFHPTAHSHEFIKRLILAKADVNAKDKAGLSALHYAAAADNWGVVGILLDHGATAAAVDSRGNTALHYAASFNSYTATLRLLEKAELALSNINQANYRGKAPIHLAAAPVSFQAVPRPIVPALALEALLVHHANPMARDKSGNTPLHLAAQGGYVEIVRRLVALTGAPPDEKNAEGLTPLAMVEKAGKGPGREEITQFLRVYSQKRSCVEPPLVRHSTRIFSDTMLGPYMRVGDTVTYTCNPGFTMLGHATVTCHERDGKMEFVPSAPLCVRTVEDLE
ncbi:hypothetical protein, conserved [Eimeria acervulina]|uniref:Sushi domain-containing protein n=1 Tax=Eimeria acervulina TaxID=5801 RepID=U6GGQ7_EIMAC|nr:hypothetical protein, conserved [Eimeria acervulina]CDI79431.1 hypothetical protein, conserved [Eimeria acervulina]